MKIIGITGGVGAGKSTILDYLSQKYDAYVIQADKIGHLVMEPGGLCYEQFCNNVWYIHTDAEIRIQRLMDSRGYTREKAESIIARQGSEEFFRKHSDYVIINNGDLKTTWKQIEEGIKLL